MADNSKYGAALNLRVKSSPSFRAHSDSDNTILPIRRARFENLPIVSRTSEDSSFLDEFSCAEVSVRLYSRAYFLSENTSENVAAKLTPVVEVGGVGRVVRKI